MYQFSILIIPLLIQNGKVEIVEVSKPQEIVVFGLETGVIGVIKLKSSNPNLILKQNGNESQMYHYAFPSPEFHNDGVYFATESPKSGYNLQLHETFIEMTITAINICTAKKCFYVGTSEGIVSCINFEVSCNFVHDN